MAAKKKRLTHSLPEVGHSRRDLQDNGLFTLLSQLFLLPADPLQDGYFEKNLASRPPSQQDGCFETLVCHLLGHPAFQIKSYSLLQHLVSLLTCHTDLLACHAVSIVNLNSVINIPQNLMDLTKFM